MLRYILFGCLLFTTRVLSDGCTPTTIHLTKGSVMATSQDNYYQAGDIFNMNCTVLPQRKYVGWCPSPHDDRPKLQINLPGVTAVNALVFQTTLAACPTSSHSFVMEAFLKTFDLQYTLPGDRTRTLMSFAEDLPALDGASAEKTLRFDPPLVTPILTITPKSHNIYPCFRFAVVGCSADSLCSPGFCQNGGKCAGKDFCTCQQGFIGDRCNMTAADIVQEDYSFQSIVNNVLTTPDADFDVVGDVSLSEDRRRSSHHHGHHSCHFQSHHGHHSYCQYSHGHHHGHHSSHSSHSSNHGNGHTGTSHCMHGLTNHHHGFTTSMHVHFGHNHHGHHYMYSNGGHLYGHHGCSLSYNTATKLLNFVVSTVTHKWNVNVNINLGNQQTHHISTSWHPHTGAHVHVNNQHHGSCGQPKPHNTHHTQTVPLRLGNGHVTVNINVNLNMSISGLNMYPAPQTSLGNIGLTGPFTPAPATATPSTTQTTTPTTTTSTTQSTTTQSTTTTGAVSATTTHGAPITPQHAHVVFTVSPPTTQSPPSTTVDHRPVCYTYSNKASTGASKTHTRCKTGEVCALFEDQKGYTAKCLEKSYCEAGKRMAQGTCWNCCDTYLCNDNCTASASGPCADKMQCAVMMATGYDVCGDKKMAVDICSKTCKIC